MIINGEVYDYESKTVASILEDLTIGIETVVVEVDGLIIAKADFDEFIVDKASKVELVAFVGGG